MNQKTVRATAVALALVAGSALHAQESAAKGNYVTRGEFQQLREENAQLRKELAELRELKAQLQALKAQASSAPKAASDGGSAAAPSTDDSKDKIAPKSSTDVLVTGYGSAGFSAYKHGDSAFNAQFNPMLLWKVSDKILFEGEVEMELEGSETSTKLEVANLSYVANDYLTFQAGKFLNPMNSFVERYHMAWVNRLPDKPLAVYDGLLPETYLGAQVRGGIPLGPTRIAYSGFVANAPAIVQGVGDGDDIASLGSLEYDNFDNPGSRVATGGHVGFLPLPELEIGYGVHYSGLSDSPHHALLQSVDFSYVRDSELLKGALRLNAQWVWSHLGNGEYDLNGTPTEFQNNRDGGYAQITYRPSHIDIPVLRQLEPVFRFDLLNQSRTPVGFNETRYTMGLNYWLTSKTVFKVAYQIDRRTNDEPNLNAILLQFATGF